MLAPAFDTCMSRNLSAGPVPFRRSACSRLRRPAHAFGKRVAPARVGFTLTELLVAVSIIAILIAIVLACLSRAREYARIAQCLSNLHQLSLAALSYAQHNRGALPSDYQMPSGYW